MHLNSKAEQKAEKQVSASLRLVDLKSRSGLPGDLTRLPRQGRLVGWRSRRAEFPPLGLLSSRRELLGTVEVTGVQQSIVNTRLHRDVCLGPGGLLQHNAVGWWLINNDMEFSEFWRLSPEPWCWQSRCPVRASRLTGGPSSVCPHLAWWEGAGKTSEVSYKGANPTTGPHPCSLL